MDLYSKHKDSEVEKILNGRLNPHKKMYKNLWYEGSFARFPQKTVGVIGSRKMTEYGKRVVTSIVSDLADSGVCIISGLMYGVDLCAHQVAVNSKGSTVGVLGYGMNYLQSVWYAKDLVFDIFQNQRGLILSQFSPDTTPKKWTFPQRNHLIAALSDVVLVIEAGEASGSLITVDYALEMGKEVFSVPGSIYSNQSKGTNKIIGQGANICVNSDVIFESLNISKSLKSKRENFTLDELSQKLLDFIESKTVGGLSLDPNSILVEFQLHHDKIYDCLLNLEFLGLVEKDLTGRYTIRP